MSDHPVLIPTSLGPIEGMVSEPDGARRAALVLLHGGGAGSRSGINAVWTRTARDLADLGVAVLRADYWRNTKSSSSMVWGADGQAGATWEQELAARHEIAEWFSEELESPELWLAGSCYGARLAIHLAARSAAISRLFLMAPYLRRPYARWRWLQRRLARGEPVPLDRDAARDLVAVVDRVPVAVVFGEHDGYDPVILRRQLGADDDAFELEMIPGLALHPVQSPDVQAAALDRMVGWASRSLAEHAVT